MILWWVLRSSVIWIISLLHFMLAGSIIILMTLFRTRRELEPVLRIFTRNILLLAGVRHQIRYSPGFQTDRAAMFICNHVNIFDPMVVHRGVPQMLRGMQLASHFRLPVYGWLATHSGNIPVPKSRGKAELHELLARLKSSIDAGISIVVFAEGHRTRDGHVAEFQRGIFNMAREAGLPIIPMSITGSYEFKRYNSLMLKPATITVWLHDSVETAGLDRADLDALRGRVHETVSRPVEEALRGDQVSPELAGYTLVHSVSEILAVDRNESQRPVPSA